MNPPTTSNVPLSRPLIMRILVRPFAYRHPKAWGIVEFATGTWVFVLGVILCSFGFWWGVALIGVALLQLWIGRQLVQSAQG